MNRKPIFNKVRAMLGRGFTQAEVKALDRTLDNYRCVPDAPSAPEREGAPHRTGPKGIALMKEFEGFHRELPSGNVEAYPDPATGGAPWTIGWGSTTDEDLRPIQPGTVWTRKRADDRFKQHLRQFEGEVKKALGDALDATSQEQFDALVSFTYNVGGANLRRSTLLRKHKAGDYAGAANEFLRWNRAAGRVMRGLTRRREAEATLYRSGS